MATARPVSFNELLRRHRRAAGLSQETLAQRAGLSRRAISDLERASSRVPRQDTVGLLAEALGLSGPERSLFFTAAATAHPHRATPPPAAAAWHPAALASLVGRREELAELERYLHGEGPPLLLLAGEPGIGKTRLLEEAIQDAPQRGWRVLAGGCHRRSGQEPYAPLVGALAQYLQAQVPAERRTDLQGCIGLVRLLPELAETGLTPLPSWTTPPEQERRLLFAAVGRFLQNVAGPAGTLLVLDDLQWAGTDALDLLVSLLQAPLETPLRVMGAYRSTEVRPPDPLGVVVADLAVRGFVTQLRVGPLPPAEARVLLGALLAEEPVTERWEQVVTRTGGVPFFLVSCARALQTEPAEERPAHGVPWNVAQSIRQRVAALPEAAQELLGVAAVIGRVVPGQLLAAAAVPEQEVIAALEAVCQAQLLLEEGEESYRFAHDLIREVVETDLSAARRKMVHRRVAQALERLAEAERGRRSADIAYHFLQANEPARALPYVLQAGEQALSVYASAEAEQEFRTALALARQLGDTEAEAMAREQLGTALTLQARNDEAFVVLEQAVAEAERRGDLPRLARLEWAISFTDDQREGAAERVARLLRLIETTEAGGSGPERAQLSITLAYWYWVSGQYGEQLTAAEQALQVAEDVDHAFLVAQARTYRGLALANTGRLEEGLVDVAAAVLPVLPVQDFEAVDHQQFTLNTLGQVLLLLGRTGEALAHTERALALCEPLGFMDAVAWASANCSSMAFVRGDWTLAQHYLERGVAQRPHLGSDHWTNARVSTVEGRLHMAQGRLEAATQSAETGLVLAQRVGYLLQWVREAQQLLAELDLLKGDPAAARDRLLPLLDQAGLVETDVNPLLPLVAWAHLELGQIQEAEKLATQTVARLRVQHDRFHLVDALRMEAAVRIQQRRWDEAEVALDETLALARQMPYPYAEAKALSTYGDLSVMRGQQTRACDCYTAALAILRPLGEVPYTDRIEQALAEMRRH